MHKKYNKTFNRFLALLESENKICDVNQKYHWIVWSSSYFNKLFYSCQRNSSITEKYNTAIWVSIEKKTLCFLHLDDREENGNKALHQRSRDVKTWSINVGRGSEAKSVNDILPRKAIALNEIRNRSSNSRNNCFILKVQISRCMSQNDFLNFFYSRESCHFQNIH